MAEAVDRVTAIMIARNEEHSLPISIGHLLNNLRVDQVIVAENGSTDATRAVLQRIAQIDGRVRWTDASGPFLQGEIVTDLARSAYREGARWILPVDADEFFVFGKQGFKGVEAAPGVDAFELDICNFVQFSWVKKDHPRALEKMVYSVVPIGAVEAARQLVENRDIAFVQIDYPRKLLLRGSHSLVIEKGNHGARIEGSRARLPQAQILHAPLRAADRMTQRRSTGRWLEGRVTGDTSWHLRRLQAYSDDQLIDEWNANSTYFGLVGPPGRKRRLLFDLRLRRIAISQRSFAASIHLGNPPKSAA